MAFTDLLPTTTTATPTASKTVPTEFLVASETHGVAQDLLLAISKQESRFSPGVQSVAGPGHHGTMPATAEEAYRD